MESRQELFTLTLEEIDTHKYQTTLIKSKQQEMGIFKNLFGSKKQTITDVDFGRMESVSIRKGVVLWQINRRFMNVDIEILISGDKDGISKGQKRILLDALNNETVIKSESEIALKEQYDNAEMKFESIDQHFDLKGITVSDDEFELTFEQKNDPYYIFNVYFENNRQVGVSIDGQLV